MNKHLQPIYDKLAADYPYQKEFLQAAYEILDSLGPVAEEHPEYVKEKVFERFVIPERIISFRVSTQIMNKRRRVSHETRRRWKYGREPESALERPYARRPAP